MSSPDGTRLLLALVCWAAGPVALDADPVRPAPAAALQMLADVTLIDHECRDAGVDFGRAFQAAESMGLRASEAMPAGALRPAFEAALRARLAATPRDELCDSVAKAYGDHVPGLLKGR